MNYKRGFKRISNTFGTVAAIAGLITGYLHPYGENTFWVRLLTGLVQAIMYYCFCYIITEGVCRYIRWVVMGFYGDEHK